MTTNRPEALLERQVLRVLGTDRGLAIFRNECGEGFFARVKPLVVTMCGGVDASLAREVAAVFDHNRVHFGLHNGSADLIGVVGGGRFVSFELKSERGTMSDEQLRWQARLRELGALAEVVRSPGDAVLYIEEARRGQR